MKRLSSAQESMLKSIRETGDPWARIHGQAAHGGAGQTLWSLARLGLIEKDKKTNRWAVREAMREADAGAKCFVKGCDHLAQHYRYKIAPLHDLGVVAQVEILFCTEHDKIAGDQPDLFDLTLGRPPTREIR
jgi:hypothetical protein